MMTRSGGASSSSTNPPVGPLLIAASLADLRAITVSGLRTGISCVLDGYSLPGDGGGGTFAWSPTSTANDNVGLVVAPAIGSGRWLRVFSGPINVMWFGADSTGSGDSTTAIQAAITACAAGGSVLIPSGSFKVTSAITRSTDNITLIIEGTILDRLTAWTQVTSDLTTTGKGVFTFKSCQASVVGNCNKTYDGGSGVSGVSQTRRPMFYFLQCSTVYAGGLNTFNGLGSGIVTVGCSNISHVLCQHNGGVAAVVHRSPTNLFVTDVQVYNATIAGIAISNRGEIDVGVLAETHGVNITAKGCYVYATTASGGDDAINFLIDTCDFFTCTGCAVNGNSVSTMGYSFADVTKGAVNGNVCRNIDNTSLAGNTYCGLGMECVALTDCAMTGNTFYNVICAYATITKAFNCIFDGTRHSTSSSSSASIGNAFASIGSGSGDPLCDNIRISGTNQGGESGILLIGGVNKVIISDFHCLGISGRFFDTNSYAAGAQVKDIAFLNCSASVTGSPGTFISFADNTIRGNVLISNGTFRGTSITAGHQFLHTGGGVSGGTYTDANISIVNVDVANVDVVLDFSSAFLGRLSVDGIHAKSINTFAVNLGSFDQVRIQNHTINGAFQANAGNFALMLFGTTAPSADARFIGQFFEDTAAKKLYIAVALGTGASDWQALN